MDEGKIKNEVAVALEAANIGPEDRDLAERLGRSYQKRNLDDVFEVAVHLVANAELKTKLRKMRDRLAAGKREIAKQHEPDGPIEVSLTKPRLPGSRKFERVAEELLDSEGDVQDGFRDHVLCSGARTRRSPRA